MCSVMIGTPMARAQAEGQSVLRMFEAYLGPSVSAADAYLAAQPRHASQ